MSTKAMATMVARHVDGHGKDVGFTLIDMGYAVRRVSADELKALITSGKVEVTNMGVDKGNLIYTNGTAERYTTFDVRSGEIVGKSRAVVLNRIEKNGELVGYVVFTHNGQICELNVTDTVLVYNRYGISNGKIRHGVNGDTISSIKDNYPLRQIEVEKASKGKIEGKVLMVCKAKTANATFNYAGVIISGDSAAGLTDLHKKLSVRSANLIAELKKAGAKQGVEALKLQRIDATAFYIVISVEDMKSIEKHGVKIDASKVAASVLEYDSEGNYTEKRGKLGSNMEIVTE